jgi:hypothetical protein
MGDRRVVMVAMPCREVVEIGGTLDILRAANLYLPENRAYSVDVVSPVATVCAWGAFRLAADRSYRSVRGDVDTLIVTGIDSAVQVSARGRVRGRPAEDHQRQDPAYRAAGPRADTRGTALTAATL